MDALRYTIHRNVIEWINKVVSFVFPVCYKTNEKYALFGHLVFNWPGE